MERPPLPVLATLLVTVGSAAFLAVTTDWTTSPFLAIPFTRISGSPCPSGLPESRVFSNQSDWVTYWGFTCASSMPPQVDFSSKMVLAVSMGWKPTAGFAITIRQVYFWSIKGIVYVDITEYAPGPSCFTAQVITSPSYMAEIPRINATFTFITTDVVRNC